MRMWAMTITVTELTCDNVVLVLGFVIRSTPYTEKHNILVHSSPFFLSMRLECQMINMMVVVMIALMFEELSTRTGSAVSVMDVRAQLQ